MKKELLFGSSFLLYRKVLKIRKIVYNDVKIKNCIAKERRGLRHDVVYEIVYFKCWRTALFDRLRELVSMDLSRTHDFPILFK